MVGIWGAGEAGLGRWLPEGFSATLLQVINFVISFGVITVLFAAIFRVLPDAKIRWRDVWVGASATAFLFVVGKTLIGIYIGQSDPGSAFGWNRQTERPAGMAGWLQEYCACSVPPMLCMPTVASPPLAGIVPRYW